jgi:hypothetical protein
MRSYNGYIAQGIDSDWNIVSVPFAFIPITGRHTGAATKKYFDDVCDDFGITNKVFKIIG